MHEVCPVATHRSGQEEFLKDDVDYIVKGSLLKAAFSINDLLNLEKILKVNHTKK